MDLRFVIDFVRVYEENVIDFNILILNVMVFDGFLFIRI